MINRRSEVLLLEQGGRGGVADYTADLVGALTRCGWSVELATATDHLMVIDPAVRVRPTFFYLRGGSPWREALRRAGIGRVVNGVAYLGAVLALLPRARRATLVHVQGGEFPPLLAIACLLLRAAGVTLVLTPHNVFDRGVQWRRSQRLVRRLCARLVIHTPADLELLTPRERAKATVIPHGEYGSLARRAGTADRRAARDELGISDGTVLALIFGQLRPDKGISDALDAVRATPGLHLLVAGEDVGAAHLVRAATSELVGRLHVREGFQSLSRTAVAFAAADVCVLAYPLASQSGVLLLSYAFATPAVVYPIGGLPDAVLDGDTGWVTREAGPGALTETFAHIVAAGPSECARRGRSGRDFARRQFDWDDIAVRTTELYRSAAARS